MNALSLASHASYTSVPDLSAHSVRTGDSSRNDEFQQSFRAHLSNGNESQPAQNSVSTSDKTSKNQPSKSNQLLQNLRANVSSSAHSAPAETEDSSNELSQDSETLASQKPAVSSTDSDQPQPPGNAKSAQAAPPTDKQASYVAPELNSEADDSALASSQPQLIPCANGKASKKAQEGVQGSGSRANSQTASSAAPKTSKNNIDEAERRSNDEADSVALSLDASAALTSDVVGNAGNNGSSQNSYSTARKDNSSLIDQAQDVQGASAAILPQPVLGDLALSLRIQSSRANLESDTEPAPQFAASASVSNPLLSASAQIAAQSAERKSESQLPAVIAPEAINARTASSSASQDASRTEASAPNASTSDFEAELNKFRAAEPVRGAHVQISGVDSQRVDIRLVERAGALSVTVRSADSSLTRSLQEHAPELNTSLHLEHFRTEMWTPSSARNSFQQQSGNQPGSSYSGGNNNQQQQNRKQQQQPEWIDEIESQSAALNKRIEYTWHQ